VRPDSILRNSLLLALIALCTTAPVAGIFQLARKPIAQQARQAQEQALLDIIPRSHHDNDLLHDTLVVGPSDAKLGLGEERLIHIARQHGVVTAVIIPVTAPDGFAGDIELRVGVNRDGSITAVRVLAHDETPGLGDRIELEHSDWLLGFDGRSLRNPALDGWAVRKDSGEFDQFTGATITPRAVVAAISRALQFAQANHAQLFGDAERASTGSK
jgi:electron transport complex protein RnfG